MGFMESFRTGMMTNDRRLLELEVWHLHGNGPFGII